MKNKRLKIARIEMDMSQEDLANAVGVTRQTISAIEKGKNNISIERLPDLAVALHTTPGKLMDVLVEGEIKEESITDGLTAESIAKLKSYAEYLKSTQGDGK